MMGARETRKECLLLEAETEANRDSRSTYEDGPSVVLLNGLDVQNQEIFVLPLQLLSALYKILFSIPSIISLHLSPSPSKV